MSKILVISKSEGEYDDYWTYPVACFLVEDKFDNDKELLRYQTDCQRYLKELNEIPKYIEGTKKLTEQYKENRAALKRYTYIVHLKSWGYIEYPIVENYIL